MNRAGAIAVAAAAVFAIVVPLFLKSYGIYLISILGGADDRRHRPQSDARLCRPGVAGAGRLCRHRRLYGCAADAGRRCLIRSAFVASGLVCFAIGWVLGYPALRVQHHYLAFVTLAFTTLVFLVLRNEEWLTGGIYGFSGIDAAGSVRLVDRRPVAASTISASAFWSLLAAATWWMLRSPWGRAFVALRENPIRALSLGLDTRRYTLMAFAIGSSLGGLSGAIYAPLVQYIEPLSFALALSLNLLLMVIVGGSGYFFGPFVGALVAVLLPEWLRFMQAYYLIFYAVLVMVMMAFCPDGILGLLERAIKALTLKRNAAGAGTAGAAGGKDEPMTRGARSRQPEQAFRRHHRRRRRVVRRARRRNPRHHRAERLGQVDAVQLRARPIDAERGRGARRRQGDDRHAPLRSQPPRRQPDVSTAAGVSAAFGARQSHPRRPGASRHDVFAADRRRRCGLERSRRADDRLLPPVASGRRAGRLAELRPAEAARRRHGLHGGAAAGAARRAGRRRQPDHARTSARAAASLSCRAQRHFRRDRAPDGIRHGAVHARAGAGRRARSSPRARRTKSAAIRS